MRKGPYQTTILLLTAASLIFPLIPQVSAATPDFALQAMASYLSGPIGGTNTIDIVNVVALNAFSGTVQLSVSYPANAYASFQPSAITVGTIFGSNSSQLWMAAFSSGLYQFNLTATSGSMRHTIPVLFNATAWNHPADFGLYTSYFPGTPVMHLVRGSNQIAHIELSAFGSFNGTVDLADQSTPTGLVTSLSLRSVIVPFTAPPGIFLSNLTITAPPNIAPGIYLVLVTATSGPLAHLGIITVSVESVYTITATPQTIYLNQGATSSSTITITTQGGYQGTINLSLPPYDTQHLSASVYPSILQLSTSVLTATAILSVTASGTIPTGSYNVNVNATDGRAQQSAQVAIVATGLDFALTPTPPALTFQPGVPGTQNFTVGLASLNGFSGAVNVTSSVESFNVPPYGVAVSPNSTLVQLGSGSSVTVTFTVAVRSDAIVGEHWIDIAATAKVGNIPIAHKISVAATVGADFSMTPDASSLTVHQGSVGRLTLTFTSLNGWSDGLAFEPAPVIPQLPNPQVFNVPGFILLTPGGTNLTRVMVMADSQTALGTFNFWMSVSNPTNPQLYIAHSLPLTVNILGPTTGPDFTISTSPTYPSLALGSTTTSTITLTSIEGFTGTLSLDSFAYGTSTLNPSVVTIAPGVTAQSTLTFTSVYRSDLSYCCAFYQAGVTQIFITAVTPDRSGHAVSVNATVAPFNVVPASSTLRVKPGDSISSEIRLSPVYGWTGAVNMTAKVTPSGPTVSFDHSTINVTDSIAGGKSLLTVQVPSSTAPGDYTVLISTTYKIPVLYYTPLLNYTTTLLVNVRSATAPNPGPPPASNPGFSFLGVSPAMFYSLLGIGIAAVALSAIAVLRARKNKHPI